MPIKAVVGTTHAGASPQLSLDVRGMIVKLSGDKQRSLENHITDILSAHLRDALDNTVNCDSGTYVLANDYKGPGEAPVVGVVLTSLKQSFLSTPQPYEDHIANDFQNQYSRVAKGESFTYSLESLRASHQWKRKICTSSPHLDLLVQEALRAAIKADGNYVIGFELDIAETQRQGQLVFAIFENNGEKEISRVLIPESKL